MSTLTLAICARNAQDIIGDCLESIQQQTVAPDEIIVAVDELSDPTVQVAEQFGARVIASDATGLYEARNAVLEACTTDYLAFTDADCILVPQWVEKAKHVLDTRENVAAGTGRHPPVGVRNFASWLHHMWYVVETRSTGETDGVIGGNSFFRTAALREVGGWLNLPRHSAAEDVYISEALRLAGHTIWFEEGVAAQHHYETKLPGLWRKSVMMGKDIVVMMRAAGWKGSLWWYTLAIPLILDALIMGLILLPFSPRVAAPGVMALLLGSYIYFAWKFRSPAKAFPRWIARWILIWPYSWGILKGLTAPIPEQARTR
ncbi:MAG: hypothetical protein COA73_06095 [Candidatus Hydrogenedentota bacterium]|nr:MAG: hypothetical protein COA73_06095 [Candidatus Hydrogenedentota bacterium]